MALNFVLMLTEQDRTIPDAVDVYEKLLVDELRLIAFKDVGTDPHMARDLTEAAHADGRSVLLELADTSDAGQEAGCQLALDLGVEPGDRNVAAERGSGLRGQRLDRVLAVRRSPVRKPAGAGQLAR